jgi:Fe2+ or Zn2+ uptake regulation protein
MSDKFLKLSDKLKDKGLRITSARKEIFNLLEKSQSSLSPKDIYSQIKKTSTTDLVSVYRNLSLFSELGLAHRFQDGTYSSCHHGENQEHHNKHEHIHLINHCLKCGKSSEIKSHSKDICHGVNQIKKASTLLKKHQVIIIQGYCEKCDE